MSASPIEIVAAVLFGVAIVHTFAASWFQRLAHRFPNGSVGENFFHLLGEVEIVFALWAGAFVTGLAAVRGSKVAIDYLEGRLAGFELSFTEPIFVFVVMTIAATKPVLHLSRWAMLGLSRRLPLSRAASLYWVALVVGPLLGSLITEPAAMTVTALVLKDGFFGRGTSARLKYLTLGCLFVNISIGGTLTHFAAPPVVMVAERWGWGLGHMAGHFGWKAAIAVVLNASLATIVSGRELRGLVLDTPGASGEGRRVPAWIVVLHVLFLAAVVATSHHPAVFVGVFLFFLGVVAVTEEHQDALKLREGLLVAAFLGGLVVLGTFQKWWIQPVLSMLGPNALFWSAAGLTAFTDNAALTYLGSLVPSLSEASKHALVAGAVTGGGLTVIANAPNPVGYGILKDSFGDGGFSAAKLLLAALVPTLVASVLLGGLAFLWP